MLRFQSIYLIVFLSPFLILARDQPLIPSQIQTIDSLEQVRAELEGVDKDALVIFDCDETLVSPNEKLLQKPLKLSDPTIQQAWNDIKKSISINAFIAKAVQKISFHLVEPCVIEIIKGLQTR